MIMRNIHTLHISGDLSSPFEQSFIVSQTKFLGIQDLEIGHIHKKDGQPKSPLVEFSEI